MENVRDLPPPCRLAEHCVYHWNMPTGYALAAAPPDLFAVPPEVPSGC